jgi:SAM-dependent methyltransferase
MAKLGEIDYIRRAGPKEREHILNKPFSEPMCGYLLSDIGTIMRLLPAPPATLLDLGAGSGWTSCLFALTGYQVTAQDISPDMVELIELNKKRYGATMLTPIVSDYESLDFDEEFDCAVFYDSLHHAEEEQAALTSVYRALKPNGVVITAEPGTGQSQTPEALRAVQEFGVTEKDMPVAAVIDTAEKIGFRCTGVFERRFEPKPLIHAETLRTYRGAYGFISASLREMSWRLKGGHLTEGHYVVLQK